MTSTNKIILVTGINGYIASHIGLELLKKGYTVRGSSRSTSVEKHLLDGAFKGYDSQYQHAIVPDMTADGAFDQAVKGVYAIIHTASPVHFNGTTVEDYYGPAVGGVRTILESTKGAGPQLQSFVLTSSIAALSDRWKNSATHVYTEDDWNTSGDGVARKEFHAGVAYGASKALAEKFMWDWKEAKSPTFSMSSVLPGVVMGPPVSFPETPQGLNATLMPIWSIYSGGKTMPPQIGQASYVDVRDVSAMHIWCAEHPEQSSGQRYMMTNGKAPPQAIADLLRVKYPDRDIIVGNPGEGYVEGYKYPPSEPKYVSVKAYRTLGVERFRDFEVTIMDTINAFETKWPGLAMK